MKRWFALLLALAMLAGLAACGSGGDGAEAGSASGQQKTEASGGKIGNLGGSKKDDGLPEALAVPIKAMVGLDGTGYIPRMDGTVIEIDGDVESAVLTADRSRVVVLETDGDLYWAPADDVTASTRISTDVQGVYLRSTGLLYVTGDEDYEYASMWRYSFQTETSVEIIDEETADEAEGFAMSENSMNMLLADGQGNIRLYREDGEGSEHLASYTDDPWLVYVSDDGTEAAWVTVAQNYDEYADTYKSESTYYRFYNGEREKLGTTDGYSYGPTVTHTLDREFFVMTDPQSDTLYFWHAGQPAVSARMGSKIAYGTSVYTIDGLLQQAQSAPEDGLYVLVGTSPDDYKSNSVYYVDANGDRDRVISDVYDFQICQGRMFYLTADEDLYTAPVEGSMLGESIKIASGVQTYNISWDAKAVCYTKDPDDEYTCSLYWYDVENDSNERLATGVPSYDVYMSRDGQSLFYMQDMDNGWTGSLMRVQPGAEPQRIGTDVASGMMNSGYKEGVDADSFVFLKYMGTDKTSGGYDSSVYNLMYYNGTEAVTLAREVFTTYGIEFD